MQHDNDDEQRTAKRSSLSSLNHHHHRGSSRHERHDSYYKYYSRGEREAELHRQPNRWTDPPTSHRISERTSLHRSDSRRNGERKNISSRRRDDASVMGASLSETYRGTLEDDGEYLDEQSAIRRSLKDARKSGGKVNGDRSQKHLNLQSEPEIASSELKKSKLETHLEEKHSSQSKSRKSRTEEDFDNVTTISKASINPYRVLGLSQSATPREVYDSYKKRRKETHPDAIGGSDKAFRDVSNAYRRLRADIKRQEARKEQQRSADKNESDHRDSKHSATKKSDKSRRRSKNKQNERSSDADEDNIVKRRQNIDGRLKDHRSLVHNLFANDNKEQSQKFSSSSVSSVGQVTTLQKAINSQSRALMELNLVPIEAGAVNINEKNETIQNNCFYLSLAASYLSGAGAFETDPTAVYHLSSMKSVGKKSGLASDGSVASTRTLDMAIASLPSAEKKLTMSLALQLKRAIEAAVVLVHPHWASDGVVGEEVQAFSGEWCGVSK